VKLSVKSDYAARAVLGLARQYLSGEAVRAEDLAAGQGIPVNYLVQILIELKSAQIVRSQRGKEGGYLLARAPSEITMGDVLRAIHGQLLDSPALTDPRCAIELREAWRKLQVSLDTAADSITFQELAEAGDGKGKMYYI
jgi:Rrf2 family transcriptional regulator, cysteine metabolism repressor